MNDADFQSIESLLEGHFDEPLVGRQHELIERVTEAFYPLHWDALTPSSRRSLARQADARDAQSMQEQNAYFWQEAVQVSMVEQDIQKLELMGAQNITEKLEKCKALAELRDKLTKLHALEHMPPFHVGDWATLAERHELRPQTAPLESVVTMQIKPLQRTAAQDTAILAAIRQIGEDPLKLPKSEPGKSGIKAEIRAALVGVNPLFQRNSTVFDKAWERLRGRGEIIDSA